MTKFLKKIMSIIDFLVKCGMIVSFLCMVFLITIQVFYRYVLVKPIPWAEEAARYFFIWATFLGATVAVKTKQHTIVSFVLDRFPEKYRKSVLFIGYSCCIIFLSFVVVYGFDLSFRVVRQKTPAMQLSMFYPYLAIPTGAFVMVLNYISLFIEEIKGFKIASSSNAHQ